MDNTEIHRRPVHFATGGNAAVAECMLAMMTSIVRTAPANLAITFHIGDAGLRRLVEKKIARWPRDWQAAVDLQWYSISRELLEGLPERVGLPRETFLRLFLIDALPDTLQTVVWLDTDTIAVADWAQLFEQNLAGNVLAAVEDFGTSAIGKMVGTREVIAAFDIDPALPYFNCGVLVIDLAQWKHNHVSQKVVAYAHQYLKQIAFGDQDGLNVILASRWTPMDFRLNVQTGAIVASLRMGPDSFNVKMLQCRTELTEHPCIIHYSGDKPWGSGWRSPYRRFFFENLYHSRYHSRLGYYRRRAAIVLSAVWTRARSKVAFLAKSR